MKLPLLLATVFSFSLIAQNLTFEQKMSDFNQLVSEIRIGYGPLNFKKKKMGLSLKDLKVKYKDLIKETKSNGDFYYLIGQFVAEFDDAHFSARVPTKHKAKLNFDTELIGGKVLITKINREKLSEKDFPFAIGDEVVEFNGKSIDTLLQKLDSYRGMANKFSNKKYASYLVTNRSGTMMPVPNGEAKVKIRKGLSKIIDEVTLKWEQEGKPLDEYSAPKTIKSIPSMGDFLDFDEISVNIDRNYSCKGSTRIKIPENAVIIMKEPFVAYYHSTEKGNIGYLRIPHYAPVNKHGARDYETRFAQYEYAVSELEANTVGLIIDQDHNCGGSVSYLHRILSLFMNVPYQDMQFRLLGSKQSYLAFDAWSGSIVKKSIDRKNYDRVMDLIKTTWFEGQNFLTKKTAINGNLDLLRPNRITYTKPIVMLIDEMSGSGGDAFPALMQGYDRATLLGTRTMGAGGHVIKLRPLGHSQLNVRMTKSLFYRPDGVEVENNGVNPDIEYRLTRDDIMYEFRAYQKFYLDQLFNLL
ncbi:S41 family peptidase [Bacteriovoracaceae bacterium]|nr:S41 family peptidase [Bacteriovoracaceae bacterium]